MGTLGLAPRNAAASGQEPEVVESFPPPRPDCSGASVGLPGLGWSVGEPVGSSVGFPVGVGLSVGVGWSVGVGLSVGLLVGVGLSVGLPVGVGVGLLEGVGWPDGVPVSGAPTSATQ